MIRIHLVFVWGPPLEDALPTCLLNFNNSTVAGFVIVMRAAWLSRPKATGAVEAYRIDGSKGLHYDGSDDNC